MEPRFRTQRRPAPRKMSAVQRAVNMAARTRERKRWKPPKKG